MSKNIIDFGIEDSIWLTIFLPFFSITFELQNPFLKIFKKSKHFETINWFPYFETGFDEGELISIELGWLIPVITFERE